MEEKARNAIQKIFNVFSNIRSIEYELGTDDDETFIRVPKEIYGSEELKSIRHELNADFFELNLMPPVFLTEDDDDLELLSNCVTYENPNTSIPEIRITTSFPVGNWSIVNSANPIITNLTKNLPFNTNLVFNNLDVNSGCINSIVLGDSNIPLVEFNLQLDEEKLTEDSEFAKAA